MRVFDNAKLEKKDRFILTTLYLCSNKEMHVKIDQDAIVFRT